MRGMRVAAAASLRVAMAIVVAGCAGPVPSPSAPPATSPSLAPALANFGIPERIGTWRLAGTAQPIDIGGPTAAIIAAAGGNPATAQDLNVQVTAGSDALAFDALRAPGVSLDAFTRAAEPRIAALGTTERSSRTVSGWTVIEYATPADFNGPPHVIDFTSRGDVIYTFGNWTQERLGVVLAGLP
jgi:hypothetical protein